MKQKISIDLITKYCNFLDIFEAPKEQVYYISFELMESISEAILCNTPTGSIIHDFKRDAVISGTNVYQMLLHTHGYHFHFISINK